MAAFLCHTTVDCLRRGHDVERIESGYLYYTKEEQPKRDWYDGVYYKCRNPMCEYAVYEGPTTPWKSDRATDPLPEGGKPK